MVKTYPAGDFLEDFYDGGQDFLDDYDWEDDDLYAFDLAWDDFDEDELYSQFVKGANRNRKIDKRNRAKQDFMKVNNMGVKKIILPLIAKKSRGG